MDKLSRVETGKLIFEPGIFRLEKSAVFNREELRVVKQEMMRLPDICIRKLTSRNAQPIG
jgi:hypothetical protein